MTNKATGRKWTMGDALLRLARERDAADDAAGPCGTCGAPLSGHDELGRRPGCAAYVYATDGAR